MQGSTSGQQAERQLGGTDSSTSQGSQEEAMIKYVRPCAQALVALNSGPCLRLAIAWAPCHP